MTGSLDCVRGLIPQPDRGLLEVWAESGVPYHRSTCESSARVIGRAVEALRALTEMYEAAMREETA